MKPLALAVVGGLALLASSSPGGASGVERAFVAALERGELVDVLAAGGALTHPVDREAWGDAGPAVQAALRLPVRPTPYELQLAWLTAVRVLAAHAAATGRPDAAAVAGRLAHWRRHFPGVAV